MKSLLYTAATLLLVNSVTPALAQDNTDYCLACPQSTCYVSDPTRDNAPWANTTDAFPQCYDPSVHVCVQDKYFLCPLAAPFVCGRACQTAEEQCMDLADYSTVKNTCASGTATGAPVSDTTAPVPTTIAPFNSSVDVNNSTLLPTATGTVIPTQIISSTSNSSICNLTLPALSALPSVPANALRIQLNMSGSNILSDITCVDNVFAKFSSLLAQDMSTILGANNPALFNVTSAIQGIESLLVVVDLLAADAQTTQAVHKLMRMHSSVKTLATAVTPASEAVTLSQLTNAQIADTQYLKDADLKNMAVYCNGDVTPIGQCASVSAAPVSPNTPATAAAPVAPTATSNNQGNSNYSYVESHLYWIVPVIVCVGVAIIATAIAANILLWRRSHEDKTAAVEPVDAITTPVQNRIYDTDSLDSIPVGAMTSVEQQHALYQKEVMSPSSKRQLILVPENFLNDHHHQNKSLHTTQHDVSSDASLYNSEDMSVNGGERRESDEMEV